jgi:diguanylate cyclase (GGDEF)-like protein
LTKHVRDNDHVYRYGGEEFLIVMPGLTLDLAIERAETLRMLIGSIPFFIEQGPINLTASIGAAAYPLNGERMEMVIDQADAALYRAKANGRNCVCGADGRKNPSEILTN